MKREIYEEFLSANVIAVTVEHKIDEQNLLQKEVLTFNDACKYLDISASHLYKLTSQKQIPHFCPQGKKLYFKRQEIDEWLLRKGDVSGCPSFNEWVEKYFKTPKMKMMYERKDGEGEYDKAELLKRYKRAMGL